MENIVNIYLIRHGMTHGNTERRYIGSRTDEPLCEQGIKELMISADKIRSEIACDVDEVTLFCSPMKRCIKTAEILFPGTEQRIIPELREMDFGDFEGKNYTELNGVPEYQKWIEAGGMTGFPGGEDRGTFFGRMITALSIIMQNISDNNIIVCHGGSIMAIMSYLTGGNYFDYQVGNGEGYSLKIRVRDNGLDVESYTRICTGISD